MSKKLILILMAVIFFISYRLVFASFIISEIMYDPAGNEEDGKRDWIEIKNTGSLSIDLTEMMGNLTRWRFSKGTNNYQLFSFNGSKEILPGGYAIVASDPSYFKIDWPNFSGAIFDSSNFSLTSSGVAVGIKDTSDDSSFSSITYVSDTNANNTGNSLQLMNNGTWKAATPTPGIINETIIAPPLSSNGENNSGSSSSDTVASSSTQGEIKPKTKIAETPKIKTQIIAKTLGFVGLPLSFDAMTLGLNGEQLRYGKYFWNFGDGDSKETQVNDSGQFTHTYFYPGDYVISLSYYYSNYYSDIPTASSQATVKIIGADISISGVGDEKDFWVELSNNTDYSADLSNWFLISDGKSFTIPRNTVLASKKKMIISPKITNFSMTDQDTLKLMTPQREIVFDYATTYSPLEEYPEVLPQGEVDNASTPSRQRATPQEENNSAGNSETIIPVENLGATVLQSGIVENNPNNSYLPIIASIIFVGASAGAVYFIRQKKVIPEEANDFEILDE